MKYHAFYIDNNLLVRIENKEVTSFEKKNNIAVLKNKDQVIGYNIFNFQTKDINEGLVNLNDTIHNEINSLIKTVGEDELELDLENYFVVGYVKELEKHPESSKLNITQVDLGSTTTQIVCGASNVAQGQKVVVAKVGAVLKNGLWILPNKLLKVESNGMICSKKELGLEKESNGIYVLDDSYNVGDSFNA